MLGALSTGAPGALAQAEKSASESSPRARTARGLSVARHDELEVLLVIRNMAGGESGSGGAHLGLPSSFRDHTIRPIDPTHKRPLTLSLLGVWGAVVRPAVLVPNAGHEAAYSQQAVWAEPPAVGSQQAVSLERDRLFEVEGDVPTWSAGL